MAYLGDSLQELREKLRAAAVWEFYTVVANARASEPSAAGWLNPWHFQAAFAKWVRDAAPELFRLHGTPEPSPYSAAVLGDHPGVPAPVYRRAVLRLRVGTAQPELASALVDNLARSGTSLVLQGGVVLHVLPEVTVSPDMSFGRHPGVPSSASTAEIRFVTPLVARHAGRVRANDPFALHTLLGRLSARVSAPHDDGVARFLQKVGAVVAPGIVRLVEAAAQPESWGLTGRDARFALLGRVIYDLSGLADYDRRCVLDFLAAAEALGVGARTAWGFGQLRARALSLSPRINAP